MATRVERTTEIENLEKEFKEAHGIYLADNNRINVAKVTKLRAEFRKKGMRLGGCPASMFNAISWDTSCRRFSS